MKIKHVIIMGIIAITCALCIGFLMTANETNMNNFKNITLADGTIIGIPSDFNINKPFSNYTDADGFYYTNCDLQSKNFGWVHIEYTHDPVNTMMHSSNSTKSTDHDHDGVYEYDVFDSNGHRVMKITGSNPAIVEKIGKSVIFTFEMKNNKITNKTVNTTTIKENQNTNQEIQKEDSSDRAGTENPKYIQKDENGPVYTYKNGYYYATTNDGNVKGAGYDAPPEGATVRR